MILCACVLHKKVRIKRLAISRKPLVFLGRGSKISNSRPSVLETDAQLVEHRSPKPRVVSSNFTAPAKENQGLARNRKPFYSDFFMQNTRTQNQTVSKPSQNENYRTRQEQMTILYLAFCLLFSKIIRSAFTCFSIRSPIPRLSTQSRRYSG